MNESSVEQGLLNFKEEQKEKDERMQEVFDYAFKQFDLYDEKYKAKEDKVLNTNTTADSKTQPYDDVMLGWLCPRCSKMNAPYVEYCSCSPMYHTDTIL